MTDPQTHLIYLLLDSNLPTGGFVASSGLESWAKHGFLGADAIGYDPAETKVGKAKQGGQGVTARRMTDFVDAELENFVSATGCFVRDAWEVGEGYIRGRTCQCGKRRRYRSTNVDVIGSSRASGANAEGIHALDGILDAVVKLDKYHEATLLSQVSRRASKAQGVAILTLFTKGLSRPPGFVHTPDSVLQRTDEQGVDELGSQEEEEKAAELVEGYKRLIRKGSTPGHLAVCWGIMTAALGLSLEKSYHLYLFLHARSVLSAAVRLNIIGPYLSSQLLLHPIKDIVERHSLPETVNQSEHVSGCDCVKGHSSTMGTKTYENGRDGGFWDWTEAAEEGPATTWPLGEVLVARHDLQHSRIFNS